jgi:hypothetical protein
MRLQLKPIQNRPRPRSPGGFEDEDEACWRLRHGQLPLGAALRRATFANILPKKGMRPKPGGSNVEIEMTGVETGMDKQGKSSNLPVTVSVSLNALAQSYGTEKIRRMEMVFFRGGDRCGRHWRLVFQPR